MHDTDPADLIEFANAWAELGDAITEQVARVVDDPSCADINPTAIRIARDRLSGLSDGLDEILDEFMERSER